VIAQAKVVLSSISTGAERTSETDDEGNYQIAAIAVGQYRLEVRANGFRRKVIARFNLEVGRISVQDFQLEVGDIAEVVSVTPQDSLVERGTISVGQVINEKTAQELPLNGRHFIDLGLLVPGSVTPPQNGNLSPPAINITFCASSRWTFRLPEERRSPLVIWQKRLKEIISQSFVSAEERAEAAKEDRQGLGSPRFSGRYDETSLR
jgi:hypothetical protein